MLRALVLASLLAGSPEEVAPAPPTPVDALAAEVRSVSASGIAPLVASDPRFAALGPDERAALLRAVALSPGRHAVSSVLNVIPGFGLGSLTEGDLRGLVLTATDTAAFVVLMAAMMEAMTMWGEESSTKALDVAPVAVAVLVAGRVAGAILPWTWDGRRHRALSRALREVPGPAPQSAVLVAPFVASAGGRAAPGATLVVRF